MKIIDLDIFMTYAKIVKNWKSLLESAKYADQ